jgi:predicted amidophosphoribosyltransferase
LAEHRYLEADDLCFYLGEYTTGKGFEHSDVNNWITNLKKCPTLRHQSQYYYKEKAIEIAGKALSGLNYQRSQCIWVPIPPSSTRSSPKYDDRLLQILLRTDLPPEHRVLDLLQLTESHDPWHLGRSNGDYHTLVDHMSLVEQDISQPDFFIVLDDVITSGAHFKASKEILLSRHPTTRIIGLFLARSVQDP